MNIFTVRMLSNSCLMINDFMQQIYKSMAVTENLQKLTYYYYRQSKEGVLRQHSFFNQRHSFNLPPNAVTEILDEGIQKLSFCFRVAVTSN